MARPSGLAKTGGRKKGTLNKSSLGFKEVLETNGLDLLEEIIEITASLKPREKVDVYASLLPYTYPKRKPIEVPFQFSEHLDLLNPAQLNALHAEVEKKLGLAPRNLNSITNLELETSLRATLKRLEEEF